MDHSKYLVSENCFTSVKSLSRLQWKQSDAIAFVLLSSIRASARLLLLLLSSKNTTFLFISFSDLRSEVFSSVTHHHHHLQPFSSALISVKCDCSYILTDIGPVDALKVFNPFILNFAVCCVYCLSFLNDYSVFIVTKVLLLPS